VAQIDLVPSLSLLLGVPIPFSSLGTIIEDLFLPSSLLSSSPKHARQASYSYENLVNFRCWSRGRGRGREEADEREK
jgi:hypothetical protein